MLEEVQKKRKAEQVLQIEEQKNHYLIVLKDLENQKQAAELNQQTYEFTKPLKFSIPDYIFDQMPLDAIPI